MLGLLLTGAPLCRAAPSTSGAAIAALEHYYQEEKSAAIRYRAYGQKALEEGFPNIARLFRAFSLSETVHAVNARKLLRELGGTADDTFIYIFDVKATQSNLTESVVVEIGEIEKNYPELFSSVEFEGQRALKDSIGNFWGAERNQMDTLRKIKANTGFTYYLLIRKIEGSAVKYYICTVCGQLEIKAPPTVCQVCGSPGTAYTDMDEPQADPWP